MNSQLQSARSFALLSVLLVILGPAQPAAFGATCCGGLDSSFYPYYGANDVVRASVMQSDGKIIIGGWFTSYYGYTENYIARLATNSAANDTSYSASLNGAVLALALDTSTGSERAVAVGPFSSANGYSVTATARFLNTGAYDTSFSSPSVDVYPYCVDVQSDGKILIGGHFSYVGGYYRPRIARLNFNGTVDTSFNAGTIDGTVYAIKALSGGQILIGGTFTSVGGASRGRFTRLSSSGAVEAFPAFGLSGANGTVSTIDLDASGFVLLGGEFTTIHGGPVPYLVRLFASDGTLSGYPDSASAPNGPVRVVRGIPGHPDNDFVIGGEFTMIGTQTSGCFARMKGSISPMDPYPCLVGNGFTDGTGGAATSVDTIVVLNETPAKAFCGGNFTYYQGNSRNRVARIFIEQECD